MKKIKLLLSLLALTVMLAACGTENNKNSANQTAGSNTEATATPEVTAQANQDEANAAAFPMTIKPTTSSTDTEEDGTIVFEDVTFEKAPEKLVVFDYGFLDTLDALGVEGIVGVAKGNFPENLKKFDGDEYGNAGTLKEPLFEDIAAMEPDVIFISGRQSTFYEELKEIAPVVFVGTQQDDYWNTFLASVNIAAELFGKQDKAQEFLAQYDAKLAEIKELAGTFNSSLVSMYNEGKLSGFATNSRFGYIYDIYGFKPVTEDIQASSHGSDFGYEAILEFNPEVLFVIDRTAGVGGESNIEQDFANDIIKKTTAYQNNRIVYLDGALWYLGGGGLTSELAKIEEILAELQ